MSRTVVIMIVSWLCIFSVSEATFGESCNETVHCTATVENCTAGGSCVCSSGYFDVSNVCNSSSITVSLSTQSSSAVYGSDVVLTATITSEVPLNPIKWLKGSKELNISSLKYTQIGVGPGQVTLNIKNVDFTDSGNYQVEVSNIAGNTSISNQVSLTVTGGKPIVSVPGTITETGTTVTIRCNASGSPAVTAIHWLWNNRNLDILDNAKYTGGTVSNPSLSIKNIAATDAGEYRCRATNLVGSTNSSQSVTLAAPSVGTISQQPAGPVNHGSSVTFTGSYTSNLPSVRNIKWQKLTGSKFIDIDITADKYTGSSAIGPSPKLVINPVQFIDEASYRLIVSNGVGFSVKSSDVLDVTGGVLTVTTGPNVTGRYGGNVTVNCSIDGPEINKIQWKKYVNNLQHDITTGNEKYSGGSLSSPPLTINDLKIGDQSEYQCTAGNKGGEYGSINKATVTVMFGQFNDGCTAKETCDSSKSLNCTNGKCLCLKDYYHNKEVCILKTGLAPIDIFLNSTPSWFSVFWSNPTTDFELVSKYEVTWRVTSASADSSGLLSRTINQYTAPSNLTPGQLYIVNVISHVVLTDPADDIVVTSDDRTMRTDPSAPGPVILSQSNFAHDNLQIKWTAPVNTLVTRYEVTVDGTTYTTMSSDPMYQFTGKVFVPGKWYIISIVTVSGTASDIVKKSSEHTEWIRTTPTKPNPPTDLQCPQSPLDISLEISWTAPTEPNGLVLRYQINVSPGNLQVYTTSNETHKNVRGLLQEQMYNFTVRTINDAAINYTSEPSEQINCTTKAGVSSSPTNLVLYEIQSRGFRIQFNRPVNVNGILAAYKIVISEGGNCVQQILVHGHCSICMSTVGCPPPINYTVTDITNNDVSYSASGLDPYTYYMVKVVAINVNGEGHPVNVTVTTKEEVPLQPVQITASNIQSSSLTLTWTLPDPSPGNTTYTIYTYEGTDDIGTHFAMKEPTKVYGFDTKSVSLTNLEEFWPYKFTVDAATVKGNKTSNFSSVFRTEQDTPGKVLNLTIQKKGSDYKSAYVSWSPPALRDRNGVLQSYLFSNNHTGTMTEEEIPVLLSQAIVEKKITVTPEAVYVVEVILQNNESSKSQTSMQIYAATAGPPPVTNIQPVTTKPGQYISTENTITIDINTEYFQNDENGKQVFFGFAVCAESKCEDIDQKTSRRVWKGLPTWRKAGKAGFPLYRVTNDTFMDEVRPDESRQKRSTITPLKFIIGEDQTCSSLNEDVYCNGPLTAGTSYIVIIFACTNGGCTYYQTAEPFVTKQPINFTNYSLIIGSVVGVTLVVAVVVTGIILWKRNRRHKEHKEHQDQANTYADLNLDERTKADQPYSLLEHGSRTVKSKSVPLNSFFDYVMNLLTNNRQKLTKEYNDLLQYTERAASTIASSKKNVLKNRGNIIPYDFNRVKLCTSGASDYIDASVLLEKCYILTSYPIATTFGNFWQMVWEQSVSTIVVITGQSDARESWYFSDNEGTVRTIERTDVELLATFKSSESVTMRKIKLSKGKHTRVVNHFHVISLEVTDLPDQILALINAITQNNVKNTGPQVVHGGCTGIDNSGVYIAVDHVVKSIVSGGNGIDVYGTARTVMKERMFSISSLEQYSAIYTCLQKYVQTSPACKNDGTGNYEYLP